MKELPTNTVTDKAVHLQLGLMCSFEIQTKVIGHENTPALMHLTLFITNSNHTLEIKALNGFYSDLPTRCIKSTQRALLSQIADMLSIQPVGAPGFKMERWATDLAKSIQGL